MFPDYLFRLIVLAALSLAGPLLASPSLQSPSTGWEKVPVGEPDSVAWFSGILASSEDVLVLSVGGKLALIDAQTGVQRAVVAKPADMDSGFSFAMSAGFVGNRLMTVSIGFLSARLDELDTTTGTWGRYASLPVPYLHGVQAPILFDGEIRFQAADRNIYRCRADDFSPLPALSLGGYEVQGSKLSGTIGDSYLTGYTSYPGVPGLLVEKPGGEKLTLLLPKKYSSSGTDKVACSPSYLVASGWENAFIWNARNLALPPRVMSINEGGGNSIAIWKDRYLLMSDTGAYGETSISIWDLAHPELTLGQITLPRSARYVQIRASEKNLWYASDGTLGRLAIGETPQISIVTLTGARANERDGTLKFKIAATPPPLIPVTVELATTPGSATENEDYQGWSGTITLTSAAPSAEVPIRILSDLKLENYETLRLTVKSVTNAICLAPEANGIITGTPAAETLKTDPLPDSAGKKVTYFWLDTGLVAWIWSDHQLFYCADGQRKWKRITALPKISWWNTVTVVQTATGHLIFSGIQGAGPSVVEIDIPKNRIVPDIHWPEPGDGRVPLDADFYLVQSTANGLAINEIDLRRYSDASLVRTLSLPFDIGAPVLLAGGRDGVSLINGQYGTYFHHRNTDGSDFFRFEPTFGALKALGADHFCVSTLNTSLSLWDTAAGALLETIQEAQPDTSATEAATQDLDLRVHRMVLRPSVPVPLKRAFKGSEAAPDVPMNVEFSEAVDFPVTVSVAWCSSPADIRVAATPAILAPGQRNLTLPFTLEDDHVAEGDEIVRVGISVTGNGAAQVFDVEVTVKDNDIVEFDAKLRDADLILSSAMDIGQGSPVFASAPHRTVADPVTQKIFQPSAGNDGEIFAHAVAGNEKYAVIGAPGKKGTAHNSFYILDRKKKSMTKRVTRPGTDTGFGSVLHLRGDRIYIGAPGNSVAGSVYAYEIPSGKFLHEFSQPGKRQAGTRYGISIASDGKSVWIGAPREGNGVVYQFNADTGKLVSKFKAPSASASNFGHSLAICGDYLAVGAPSRNAASAVLIYKRSSGSLVGTIPSPFEEGGCFGTSLAGMGGTRLAIGCPERPGFYLGGVMIHDLKAKSFPLIVMLTPSQAANKYHGERIGTAGKTGSLSASGDFLGIQFDRDSDIFTAYTGGMPRGIYSEVVYIASVAKRTTATTLADASEQNPIIVPSTTAVPQLEPSVGPPSLEITCNGSEAKILLPSPDVARGSLSMVLEASEDLATWTDIATTGGGTQEWIPLVANVLIDPESREIKVPTTPSGHCYFRLRMEDLTP